MNQLQNYRYLEDIFIYFNTQYRIVIREEIDKIIEFNIKSLIYLKGLMGSGKSYFLSDYVLQKRFQGKESRFRILYINNSEAFLRNPIPYLFNEIKYMLCFDFEDNNNEFDFKNSFEILDKDQSIDGWEFYKKFLKDLKKYFLRQNKKLILIWDQINVLYREQRRNEQGFLIYSTLSNNFTFFDHIILIVSNENQEINLKNIVADVIEMNPFQVFTNSEFESLIEAETYYFKLIPCDLKEKITISKYIFELCKLLNYSISEYHCYKLGAWNEKKNLSNISKETAETNKNQYIENRKIEITNSEEKFRLEYLKKNNDLCEYYLTIRKLIVYNDALSMEVENNFPVKDHLEYYIIIFRRNIFLKKRHQFIISNYYFSMKIWEFFYAIRNS